MRKKDKVLLGIILGLLFIIAIIGMILSEKIGPIWASFSSSIGAGCITSFVFLLITYRREAYKEEQEQTQTICDDLMKQFLRLIEADNKLKKRTCAGEKEKRLQEIVYYGTSWFRIFDDLVSKSQSVKTFLIKSNSFDNEGYHFARIALANLDSPGVLERTEITELSDLIKPLLRFICVNTAHTMEWTQMVQHDAWDERRKLF